MSSNIINRRILLWRMSYIRLTQTYLYFKLYYLLLFKIFYFCGVVWFPVWHMLHTLRTRPCTSVWNFENVSGACIQINFSVWQIWNCVECYCFFHLTCIQRWAKDSVAHQKQALEDQPRGFVVVSFKWAW